MPKTGIGQDYDYTAKLKQGVKGDISVNAGLYKGRYPSQVEETGEDGTLLLAHPLLKGALLPVYREMRFSFTLDDGTALYAYDMIVQRPINRGGLMFLSAQILGEPQRIQRRNFLRMACSWEVRIFPIEAEYRLPMSFGWIGARALDISLRGTRVNVGGEPAKRLTFETGDKALVRFPLFERDYVLMGTATRVTGGAGSWEVSMSFDTVGASVERKLFEYIRQQEIMGREGQ